MKHDVLLRRCEEELRLRRYSCRTMQAYLCTARRYLAYLEEQGGVVEDVSWVRLYLLQCEKKDVASGTLHVLICGLKFFYRHALESEVEFEMKFPRKPRRLPVVLSQEEVRQLLDAVVNRKHR